jgi:hypothetical protein
MSKGGHDIFALVINFLGANWQPKHIIIGLFEVINIKGQTLGKNLTKLLDIYELKKIVAYVKDEGYNLNIMSTALKLIINCDVLGLGKKFQKLVLVMHFIKHVHMQQ